ncbi:UBN2 domain-containing protein [Cephalotus follicularis]|uniref:UBN2 domain-containing protein n=1 Tax=Cephalotus follicularis TaxID=3775 RepID=A0A1Q3CWS8_CEPFO|nr:UBN2 domain-containing protein [Cephalotus follicularis]
MASKLIDLKGLVLLQNLLSFLKGFDSFSWLTYQTLVCPGYDIWDTISNLVKKLKKEATNNFKALSLLHSAVIETIFPRIIGVSMAKEAWDILKEEFYGYDRTRAIRLLHLRRDFANLKMKESKSIKDFVSKLMEVVNQMKIYGEVFIDKAVVEKVLINLTEKFDPKIAAIKESRYLSQLIVTKLIGYLQAHEQRLMKREEATSETAFQAKHKGKQQMEKDGKKSPTDKFFKGKNGQTSKEFEKKKPFPHSGICQGTNHTEKFC